MSDCRVPEPRGYDVARLRIEFQDGEVPWMYPLALNGRVIRGVYVDGERYERVRECENAANEWGAKMYYFVCSECGWNLPNVNNSGIEIASCLIRACPLCGAKVVSA